MQFAKLVGDFGQELHDLADKYAIIADASIAGEELKLFRRTLGEVLGIYAENLLIPLSRRDAGLAERFGLPKPGN